MAFVVVVAFDSSSCIFFIFNVKFLLVFDFELYVRSRKIQTFDFVNMRYKEKRALSNVVVHHTPFVYITLQYLSTSFRFSLFNLKKWKEFHEFSSID